MQFKAVDKSQDHVVTTDYSSQIAAADGPTALLLNNQQKHCDNKTDINFMVG